MEPTVSETPSSVPQATNSKRPAEAEVNANTPNKSRRPRLGPKSKRTPTSGKRTIATFEKKKDTSIIFTFPILTFFSIHTQHVGITTVARHLYEILQARDSKMTNCFSLLDLQYVSLLTSYYRCALITNQARTQIIRDLSLLKDAVDNILLPDVICKIIEILGSVKTVNGITVIPHFDSYNQLREQWWFQDPIHYLTADDRRTMENGSWPVNIHVIVRVQQGLSRALKGILEIRQVKKELEGSEELLSSYEYLDNGRIVPGAFQALDTNTCTLGAVLQFRESNIADHTGTLKMPCVHEAPAVEPESFLTTWILKQLKQA